MNSRGRTYERTRAWLEYIPYPFKIVSPDQVKKARTPVFNEPYTDLSCILSESSNPTNEGFATWMMKQGGSGCFRHTVDTSEDRLNNYGRGVNLFSSRKVKFAEDCLKAFTGMLQTFENMYPRGFIEGPPIEDLDWSLLWHSRGPSLRRREFPSWCWAAWEGAVWYGQHPKKPRRFPINLDI